MFMTGASGMVVEYVLSTVSSYLNGTQIESFSLTIAVMLGMMGIGGYAQRFVSDEKIIEKFVYLEMGLAIISGFAPIAVYAAFSYTPEHFQLVYYFFAMTIGFMVGFEIPFITRANVRFTKKLKDNLSIVFAADYIGAFFGAVFWVYILLPYMHLLKVGFVLAALNFVVAMMTYLYFKRGTLMREGKLALVLMASIAVLLAWGYTKVVDWSVVVEQKMYPDPIVASEKTKYQQLTLTYNRKLEDTRLYINGSTQFSSLDEVRYHEMLVHVPVGMLPRKPENVLVLGGGDGLAVRDLLKYEGVSIDLIELDEGMYSWAKENPRMTGINQDAFNDFKTVSTSEWDLFLQSMDKSDNAPGEHRVYFMDASNFINAYVSEGLPPQYDMVVIDLPDPYSLGINKMYTEQFYKRVHAILKEDGILVTQATSPFHAKPAFLTIGETLKSAGYYAKPYRQNIPSFGDWGVVGSEQATAVF